MFFRNFVKKFQNLATLFSTCLQKPTFFHFPKKKIFPTTAFAHIQTQTDMKCISLESGILCQPKNVKLVEISNIGHHARRQNINQPCALPYGSAGTSRVNIVLV